MTTTTINETGTATTNSIECGTKVAFNNICHAGCYVNETTGHLIRVSADFDAAAWTNWISCEGSANWWTCVSTDPNCSTEECRSMANASNIHCCF